MPYLTKDRKAEMKLGHLPKTGGDLNYLFTNAIIKYINGKGLRYQTINDILGALEGCKLELYRRIATDYEDKKIKSNGDVYDNCIQVAQPKV
jgi:hypothetical protein